MGGYATRTTLVEQIAGGGKSDRFGSKLLLGGEGGKVCNQSLTCRYCVDPRMRRIVESPRGLSPPGAPRSVREPLDSYGSRCSAVSMTEPPVGEECWIYSA